ncbi:putative tail sheath protein [Bacillus phage vB_BspM_Internexus]|nr:putative tail sheath protein [Bacillus phage vB_BspM_Internexus]
MATEASTSQSISTGTEVSPTWLHPSVTSVINSEEITYQSGSGQQKMLSIFTSEKGEDNKLVLYTDPDEFIAKTGNPNLKKYGQSAYNIINWLKAGGEVYGMRVMPDNAGFAHAFLNVLSKVDTKKVKDKDGNAVSYKNVTLKPAVAYSDVNNVSETLLNYELNKDRSADETIDGFKNHLLFAVYPTGRGSAYNNLGFRITLNTSYDEQHDFRVYNFEVIRYDEYNTANIIEGPFYVSLSPDALSSSNESMFIADVVNKYSTHLRCMFNEDAFLDLCRTINPDVSPSKIDPLTGKTRTVRGVVDTFYSNITKKFEDTHISLHRYDTNGNVMTDSNDNPILNIIDAGDLIEQSILLADNTYRKRMYERYLAGIDYMKQVFNSIENNDYNTIITKLLYTPDGVTPESGLIPEMVEKLNGYHTTIQNLVTVFNSSHLESDFNRIVTENTLVEQGIKDIMSLIGQLLSYHKALEMSSTVLDLDEKVNSVYNKLNLKEIIDIRAVSKKDKINEISDTILTLKGTGDEDEQASALTSILSDIKTTIDYLLMIINENSLSATDINQAVTRYNAIIDMYNAIFDPIVSNDAAKTILANIYNSLDELVADLYNICELAIVNIDLLIIDDIISKKIANIVSGIVPVTYTNTELYAQKVSTTEGKAELLSSIRKNIDNSTAVVTVMKSIVYTTQLQDFNSPAIFMNGSDGDLDESNPTLKSKTMLSLLVKGYQGLIDDSVTNRKVAPFQFVLDANYPTDVKNAIVTLARDIRKDIFFYADSGIQASPADAISWRNASFNVSSQFLGIYTQDFVVYDEYNGRDIKVTPTYFLATKIPSVASQYGLQYPIAGNKRGTIDGFKSISYVPNESYKEQLYTRQLNYVEHDSKRTKFGSQLTADMQRTPLSNINNAIIALDIKRNVEEMAEDYQFEFEDDETIRTFQYNLNDYLSTYISNRSCDEISATVYASDYDKTQQILRVKITVKFKAVVERIVISIDVVK